MERIDFANLTTLTVDCKTEVREVELSVRTTEEGKHFLFVGDEKVAIADYKAQISADGEAEICVTIKGKSASAELLTELEVHDYILRESLASPKEQM